MLGLLAIGSAFALGIGMRVAAASGALLYVMMWSVALPPQTNPFPDEHLISAAVMVGLALVGAGLTPGDSAASWETPPLVRRLPRLNLLSRSDRAAPPQEQRRTAVVGTRRRAVSSRSCCRAP